MLQLASVAESLRDKHTTAPAKLNKAEEAKKDAKADQNMVRPIGRRDPNKGGALGQSI